MFVLRDIQEKYGKQGREVLTFSKLKNIEEKNGVDISCTEPEGR